MTRPHAVHLALRPLMLVVAGVLLFSSFALWLIPETNPPVRAALAGVASLARVQIPQVQPSPAPPPVNVYASMMGPMLPSVAGITPRVYVPNNSGNDVDVIDPATFKIIDSFPVGAGPHHIAPDWDEQRLFVDNELSNSLTVIDIHTGKPSGTINVPRPYNLYFTPDGTKAIVVTEAYDQLNFFDRHTWQLLKTVRIPGPGHPGVDHLDFSADGSYLLASTEYTGELVKVDTNTMEVTGIINIGGLPVDVRLSPDGSVFYVTDQWKNGLWIVDPVKMQPITFLPTGRGAHGLQISRDTTKLYISNRLEGTISVFDIASRKIVAKWTIGGSPDMLQIDLTGRQLWASGRYNSEVYVVDTTTGQLLATIHTTGAQPHGLTYFPNAGAYSTGHNGVYR